MERILVSMHSRHGAWEALSRAISLAKRMDARIYALLVVSPETKGASNRGSAERGDSVRKHLELLIESAKLEGTPIHYFISEGRYEEEVIRFVEHNRISLVVAEMEENDSSHPHRDASSLQKIRHRIKCRVELVSPRRKQAVEASQNGQRE